MVNILKYLMLSDGQNISGFQESVLGVEITWEVMEHSM